MLLGFTAAGAVSRISLKRNLHVWSFSRTIATGMLSAGAGYWMAKNAQEWSYRRFNRSTDSPVTAMIAKSKIRNALAKDQIEQSILQAERHPSDHSAQILMWRNSVEALEEAEEEDANDILIGKIHINPIVNSS